MRTLSQSVRYGRKHRPDFLLLLCVGSLLMSGLVIIYSISPVLSHKLLGDVNRNYYLYGQLVHGAVGLAALLITANIHYERWRRWLPGLIILCGLSLLLLMIPGLSLSKNGATRWVNLGILSFQPAELLKLTLVIGLASYYATQIAKNLTRQLLGPTLALLGVLGLVVVVLQRDLGTMAVIAAIVIGLFFASGVEARQLLTLLGVSGGVGLVSIVLFPHRLARLVTFLNPNQNISGSGYHLNQALIALGSGGLFGLGIGKSVQVYGYLPEAANDSIFAIIGETFGLLGALILLGVFGLLLQRVLRIARLAPNRYSQLLAVGIGIWIGVQASINIMAMLGLVPLTGIPLPFLSYGGTSLIMMMAAIGIVVNISKYSERGAH